MDAQLIVYAFGMALSIGAVLLPHIKVCAADEAGDSHRRVLEDIEAEFNCKGLRGATEAETEELLQECRVLMRTSVMQKSKEYLMNAAREELEDARLNFILSNPKLPLRTRRSVGSCPVMDDNYLSTHTNMGGMRSLSPYAGSIDYDANRFPKYVVQNDCLCTGCIDPNTGKETFNYLSHVITAITAVFRANGNAYKTEKQPINVGCTCVRPNVA